MSTQTNKVRAIMAAAIMALALMACGGTQTATTPATTQPAATSQAAATEPTSQAAEPAATATEPAATAAGAATEPTSQAVPEAAATATKLNLNELTEEQLLSSIPNFSNRMVREFMEYRPYISILQFRKEIGKYVSAEEVAAYEQYVYVPVDVDQADAATLQQLPGVDATIADQLIAGRPYGSNQAFLAKLASAVSDASAKQAEAYLAAK